MSLNYAKYIKKYKFPNLEVKIINAEELFALIFLVFYGTISKHTSQNSIESFEQLVRLCANIVSLTIIVESPSHPIEKVPILSKYGH